MIDCGVAWATSGCNRSSGTDLPSMHERTVVGPAGVHVADG
jgi:hypothetical protein